MSSPGRSGRDAETHLDDVQEAPTSEESYDEPEFVLDDERGVVRHDIVVMAGSHRLYLFLQTRKMRLRSVPQRDFTNKSNPSPKNFDGTKNSGQNERRKTR